MFLFCGDEKRSDKHVGPFHSFFCLLGSLGCWRAKTSRGLSAAAMQPTAVTFLHIRCLPFSVDMTHLLCLQEFAFATPHCQCERMSVCTYGCLYVSRMPMCKRFAYHEIPVQKCVTTPPPARGRSERKGGNINTTKAKQGYSKEMESETWS